MPIFVESFDSYNGLGTGTGLLSRWFNDAEPQSARQALVAGRFAGQAYSGGAGNGSTVHGTTCLIQDYNGNNFDVTAGFSMHVALRPKSITANGTECGLVFCTSAGVGQLGIQYHNNSWRLVRWGAVVGGSPAAILFTSAPDYGDLDFRSFAIKGVIHGSAGSVALRIDGQEVYSGSGLNTGTGPVDRISVFQGNIDANAGIVVDDLVIKDSAAAYLPDLRIDQLSPNSDGGTLNWTPSTGATHYGVVDDSIVTTADYLSASNVGDIDLLGFTNMASTPSSIVGLNLVGYAAKTDVAARSWNLGIKSGATTQNGADLTLATAAGYYSRSLETDPNTGVAWTKTAVDAAELQPRVAV